MLARGEVAGHPADVAATLGLRRYSLVTPAGDGLVLVHWPGMIRHPQATAAGRAPGHGPENTSVDG